MSAAARPEFRRNWLLKRLAEDLRSENGLLEIEYDRYPVSNVERTGRAAYSQPRYYFMPDHGIFVSRLIRNVAPKPRIPPLLSPNPLSVAHPLSPPPTP